MWGIGIAINFSSPRVLLSVIRKWWPVDDEEVFDGPMKYNIEFEGFSESYVAWYRSFISYMLVD